MSQRHIGSLKLRIQFQTMRYETTEVAVLFEHIPCLAKLSPLHVLIGFCHVLSHEWRKKQLSFSSCDFLSTLWHSHALVKNEVDHWVPPQPFVSRAKKVSISLSEVKSYLFMEIASFHDWNKVHLLLLYRRERERASEERNSLICTNLTEEFNSRLFSLAALGIVLRLLLFFFPSKTTINNCARLSITEKNWETANRAYLFADYLAGEQSVRADEYDRFHVEGDYGSPIILIEQMALQATASSPTEIVVKQLNISMAMSSKKRKASLHQPWTKIFILRFFQIDRLVLRHCDVL